MKKIKKESNTNLSKFMSLILRHDPQSIGITLDEHGWADTEKLIYGMNQNGKEIDMTILEEIVSTDSKQRYSFNENKTKIRANQGHSINIDLELKEIKPPEILYHGTATRFISSIKESGLIGKTRRYVHLSNDKETAEKVGRRHGVPVVLSINAEKMYKDGLKFYLSENKVWLCKNVAVKYIYNI